MNAVANTGLIICVSGDGPRYDLHFHCDKSRFTKTAVEVIVKAAGSLAEALVAQGHPDLAERLLDGVDGDAGRSASPAPSLT